MELYGTKQAVGELKYLRLVGYDFRTIRKSKFKIFSLVRVLY